MDLLLLSPPLTVKERYDRSIGDVGGDLPPLGIASLAAFLLENGFSVDIIDGPTSNLTMNETIEEIKKRNPKAIGISAMTFTFHRALEMAEELNKRFPEKLVLLGGPHVTLDWQNVFRKINFFDIGVLGEGEFTLLELMQNFKQKKFDKKSFLKDEKFLKKTKGIAFKSKGKIVKTDARPFSKDLDVFPFPARHLLPMHKYIPLPNSYLREPVAHIVAIRGCPYCCTYCSEAALSGNMIRSRSPKKVVEEVKKIIKEFGAKEISFWDDMINVNRNWLHELCNLLIKENLDIVWNCYARINHMDLETLKLMKKAGCWNIFYGIESGNQQLLNNIKKGLTLDQIRKVIKWTKEAGIQVRASFMIALPGETPELAQQTIDFAKELDPEYAHFCITTPFPGTELYRTAEKWGNLSKDLDKFTMWNPVFVPFGYKSREEIMLMEKKAFKEFYFRPKFILKKLLAIRSFTDIKRYFKGLKLAIGFSFSGKNEVRNID